MIQSKYNLTRNFDKMRPELVVIPVNYSIKSISKY